MRFDVSLPRPAPCDREHDTDRRGRNSPRIRPQMVGATGTDGPAPDRRSNTRDPLKVAGFGSQSPDARER